MFVLRKNHFEPMKHHLLKLLIVALSFVVFGCKQDVESFEVLDFTTFNNQISGKKDISTPEALILRYYNWSESEGEANIQVEAKEVGSDLYAITLIHDNLKDDSLFGIKIQMRAKKNTDGSWKVKTLKKNWRCRENRGSTEWGVSLCY